MIVVVVAAMSATVLGGAAAAQADVEEVLASRVQDLRRLHPEAAVATSQGGPDRVVGEDVPALLDVAADPARPETYSRALELLLQRHGVEVAIQADADPLADGDGSDDHADPSYQQTPAPQPTAAITEGVASGGIAYPGYGGTTSVAGDLSGDGLDDVVQVQPDPGHPVGEGEEAQPPPTSTVRALRGTDGAELWSTTIAGGWYHGVAVQPVGDATGDGAADLLLSVQQQIDEGTGECDAQGCSHAQSFTWVVQLLDGRSGAATWELTFEGSMRYTEHFDGRFHDSEHHTVNAYIPVEPLQDVTGDGVGDFLFTLTEERGAHTTTIEGTYPGTRTEVTRTTASASTTVQIRDGADATVVEEVVEDDRPSVLSARALPDTTGDDVNDVLLTRRQLPTSTRTCTYEGTSRQCTEDGSYGGIDVELRSGADLDRAVWSHSYPVQHGFASAPGDLTGDGVRDVIVTAHAATGESVLAVLSGRDGDEAWSVVGEDDLPYGGGEPLVATPIEDDGALDLLSSRYRLLEDGRIAVEVLRRDGATGEELSATLHTSPEAAAEEEYAFIAVSATGDADGDGTQDVLVMRERYTEQDGPTVTTWVESGRTGEILATLPPTAPFHGGYYTSVGDLDGDGGTDAITFDPGGWHQAEEEGVQPPSITAVRLRDGSVLWQQTPPPNSHVFDVRPADFDGDAGGDVLVHRDVFTEFASVTQAVALDGEDGSTLWSSPPPPQVQRVAGEDRIATAVALSTATYDRSDTVVIARADAFPDALAGGPLAGALDAPLLLTGTGGLDTRTAGEVARLGATSAVLLGGAEALSPQVEADLGAVGVAVERLAGADRFATAVAIADRMAATVEIDDRVAVASGGGADPQEGWTDAIIASAYGAATGAPLLLVQADAVPEVTQQALDRLDPAELILVGSGEAVSTPTEAVLTADGARRVHRLFLETPAATSRLVADWAIGRGADPAVVWVATSQRFPDALAASAAVGATDGILLLTDGAADSGIGEIESFLDRYGLGVRTVTVVGGPAAITPEVETSIADAARPSY